MIEARHIIKRYGDLEVLRGVDVTIGEAEVVTIVGPSGAGKTTLLHIIGTLDQPDSGSVIYDGTDVITNLDNYSDLQHYSGEVSDSILLSMARGEHELTKENYIEYFDSIEEFYMNYDYSQINVP